MSRIDQGLRTLAGVTEAVGDDRYEVVGVEVETTDDDTCGTVTIEGTLFDDGVPEDVRIEACNCSVSDSGEIQLDLTVVSESTGPESETTAETSEESEAVAHQSDADNDTGSVRAPATSPGQSPEPAITRRTGESGSEDSIEDSEPESVVTNSSDATPDGREVTPAYGTEGRNESSDQTATADDTDDGTAVETRTGGDGIDENDDSTEGTTQSDDDPTTTVPAYRDPDRLAEVYDTEDTFAEMTDALDADVTSQTVRRYMIEHGIHEPRSQPAIGPEDADKVDSATESAGSGEETPDNESVQEESHESDTANDGPAEDDEGPETIRGENHGSTEAQNEDADDSAGDAPPDDAGTDETAESATGRAAESAVDEEIPLETVCDVDGAEDLTLGELIDAAVGARTMYEIQNTLDLDTDTTRALLEACDLIDLVAGRITRMDGPDEPDVRSRVANAIADGRP